ncbi:MAG: AarF/ABC1/UbiB kinase family protein [Nanoarchaeota archaeon]
MAIPERLREVARFNSILRVLVQYELAHFFDAKTSRKHRDPDPIRLRRAMEKLGGTFIKLGQLLSLRPDLIPERYCRELAKFQDKVAPFSLAEAKSVLSAELKSSAKLINLKERIATASIGQVYRAEIKNQEVAVKIMRPGIEQKTASDLQLLYHLADFLKKKHPDAIIDPVEIYEQFKIYTENELDYLKEAGNIEAFGKNFEKTHVRIPHVYWHFTTRRVLTMEYMKGKPVTDARLTRAEKGRIAEDIVNAISKQIFIDGLFHADPHPGNIILMPEGNIAFIDFGIVGKMNERMKKDLASLFAGLVVKDLDAVADSFMRLNLLDSRVDHETFKSDLTKALGKYYGKELKSFSMGELIMNAIGVAQKNHIKVPKDYVLLGKSVITTEGVCRRLSPSFNIVEASRPFVRQLVKKKFSPKEMYAFSKKNVPKFVEFMAALPDKTNMFLSDVQELDEKLKVLDKDIVKVGQTVNRAANRLVMGIIIGALVISFALVVSVNPTYALVLLILALLLILDLFIMIIKER